MIAHQARTAATGLLLVAAVLGLWFTLNDPAPTRHDLPPEPPTAPTPGHGADADPETVPTEREALDVLQAPADLDEAMAAAETFTQRLYRNDLDGLRDVITDQLATTLLTPSRSQADGSTEIVVDGVITKDVQPDRILAEIVVRRDTSGGEQLEVVTVSAIRVGDRWLIDDTAF